MTVDLAKARALVEPLLGASYALPSDARGWFDHPTAGHVPHNVCTDAADTIDALLDERERLVAENSAIRTLMDCYNLGGWTDSLRLMQERDALARDAARYRWIRRDVPYDECAAVFDKHSEDELDAAIDAAMGASDE